MGAKWRQRRQGARRQGASARGTHSRQTAWTSKVRLADIRRRAPAQQRGSKDRDKERGGTEGLHGRRKQSNRKHTPSQEGARGWGETKGETTTKTRGWGERRSVQLAAIRKRAPRPGTNPQTQTATQRVQLVQWSHMQDAAGRQCAAMHNCSHIAMAHQRAH